MGAFLRGALLSPKDPRDYTVRAGATTQDVKSWRAPRLPSIGDQKVNGCVNWALSYIQEMHDGIVRSKNMVYSAREADDYQGEGMYPHEALDTLVRVGNVATSFWPEEYEVTEAQEQWFAMRSNLEDVASKDRIKSYARIENVSELKTVLMNGGGVIFSAPIHTFSTNADGVFRCISPVYGYHAMTVVDFDEENYPAPFRVANSWGESWGVDGFCYMSAVDIFRENCVFAVQFETDEEPRVEDYVRRTLRLTSPHMKGNDVVECQMKLLAHGFDLPKYGADGDYGNECQQTVIKFQRARNLDADGIVGKKTWAELDKDIEPTPEPEDPIKPSSLAMALVSYCYEALMDIYVWGAYDDADEITESWIRRKDDSDSKADRSIADWHKKEKYGVEDISAYDCSGLISAFLIEAAIISKKKNCDGLWVMCEPVEREDLIPGDLLFRVKNGDDEYHVGVYAGRGRVIHAKGRNDGVVIEGIYQNGNSWWNAFGRLKCLYEMED